ncbi:MAG: wax ester/triacylglycerol synthase family O-acyltransferase [Nocardioidaceae bacterium]|nr:wax ester/triacylglycerol synthase family O-acyltransferase [Nocardioidaceae bacterium]MCL2614670.1 wax ester/triacylglycerol synthase family O-acyltransferase [Nocardioidaceae bacterium]
MDRLSGLDASFLYLETPAQLMHVCAVMVLDPSTMPSAYDFEELRRTVGDNVGDVPTFTRKVRSVPLGLDHPVWVTDRSFDIERHVHRLALPTPGGYAELMDLCAHLASLPLDRSRPLWQMWIIEGYRPAEEEGERVVVFLKMHHATVDGVSGANLLSHLCSLEPGSAPMGGTEQAHPRDPSRGELLGRAVAGTVAKPLVLAKVIGPSAQVVTRTLGRVRRGTAMAAPFSAPRTSFNGTITGHRSIALADIDLADVRSIKQATGTTVNDVVLAVCGGALRAYLDERGELPTASLLATVPVSVRDTSRRDGGANKVSALFSRLGTDLADPLERLAMLAERNQHAKDHHNAIPADALQDWAEFAAPRTFGLAMRTYANLRLADKHPVVHNLVISNVPGPPMPLYFAGARIDALYPLGPVFHGAGLNVTVMSNAGQLHVGAIACRESMPDADALVRHFPDQLERLMVAVGSL